MRRAAELATAIEEEIETNGYSTGYYLGSEPFLCEKYDVSRAIFRECVRLLEHYQLARMKTGRGGGLIVTEPGGQSIAAGIALLLRRRGLMWRLQSISDYQALADARRAVALMAVRLAISQLDETGVAALKEMVNSDVSAPLSELRSQSGDFHLLIARLSGNPVLELLTEVLVDLTRQRVDQPNYGSDERAEVIKAHSRIADAIIARDVPRAERFMNIHIDAMISSWARNQPTFHRLSTSAFDLLDPPTAPNDPPQRTRRVIRNPHK
jgi:DNA-binding FadR family transcriptional regulator